MQFVLLTALLIGTNTSNANIVKFKMMCFVFIIFSFFVLQIYKLQVVTANYFQFKSSQKLHKTKT